MSTIDRRDPPEAGWLWKDLPPQKALDETFVQKVIQRTQQHQLIRDYLFMILRGFWEILLGFTRIAPPSSQSNKPGRKPR